MDQSKLDQFKDTLISEKKRLEDELTETGKFNLSENLTGAVEELSAYDNHPADLGSETFEREKDLALWNNTHEILNRVNDALQRIDEGTYGICEDCGGMIDEERLKIVPYSSLCINCQQEDEKNRQTRQRPIEEESLSPPFGRTFLDKTEVVATDGEDIWQDVAKYGTSESPSDLGGMGDYEENFYDAPERQGIVEEVDGIIDVGPDNIPPDPRK